ncbi:MAG: YebC/PmpR family DNA-binding transcriptional regulator [Kiritimatiellaeota bacterium]|nr:YebC/PmpR family DNA-binding transcriptional regulator [Kiritimatiellota bacterium]
MSGHSKWANIKHKKGAADKKRGRIFSRISKEITVAARGGGGEPNANPRLRTALTAARAVNMPNANIDRAIKKGTGELDGEAFVEMSYEGFGHGGVAILVECLSDNKNRTASEVRLLFDRNGGNLAAMGAVSRLFHRKSRFVVLEENADEESLFDPLIDAGAEDISADDGMVEILGPPESFEPIAGILEKNGIAVEESGVVQHPENLVSVDDVDMAGKLLSLLDKLEDQEDVQAVYSNVDIPDEVMKKLSEEDA